MEKTKGELLSRRINLGIPQYCKGAPEQREAAEMFCAGYKAFLDKGKTERECVKEAVKILEAAGYEPFEAGKKYAAGDKVYMVNRKKAVIATTFGSKSVEEGLRFNGAHIDSPRLDLKPNPVYEKKDLAYFKTHYYGGIRKYQWGATPLSMHGVIVKKNGEIVEVNIGEQEGDPVFCVTDLLPHLAADQNMRPLKDGLKGEELNVIIGSIPYVDEAKIKEPVKLLALQLLNERYGITEADFFRAEIELVPAHKASDVGLDRSMIGAYGQDDRVCAYTGAYGGSGNEESGLYDGDDSDRQGRDRFRGKYGTEFRLCASLCGGTGRDAGSGCEARAEEFHLFILRCKCSL